MNPFLVKLLPLLIDEAPVIVAAVKVFRSQGGSEAELDAAIKMADENTRKLLEDLKRGE